MIIARNFCRSVAELHETEIIHSDLSSGNILINSASNDIKLNDLDYTSTEGTTKITDGNEDFASEVR